MMSDEVKICRTERKDTDDSLVAERAKATKTLETANLDQQDITDDLVRDERSIADEKTAVSRARHDETRKGNTAKSLSSEGADELTEERRRTDVATDVERSKMDAALSKERKITKTVVSRVLDEERKVTDHNLSVERDTADIEFGNSSRGHKKEIAEHHETKMSLSSRDEFMAIVSHDLRNPIGAVSSYADLLLEEPIVSQLSEDAISYVEAIKRNAESSLRLVTDLMDVERFAQGKLELKISSCRLNDLVRNVVENFANVAHEKGIQLEASTIEKSPSLTCDRDRITQVLGNLVGNALKFTPTGGSVQIKVLSLATRIEISVTDSGEGVAEDLKDEIFKRFAQAGTSKSAGLGLGLFISRTLAEAHGGTLTVSAASPKGSVFKLVLPVGLK